MADLFKEIIPSILQTKEYALLTEQDEKSYSAFMVNRALSFHRDTVLWANEMNRFTSLDNKLKYDFLINTIRAQKRPYSKWHKKAQSRDLSVVKEYYGYSDAKAEEALKILSDDQIAELKKQLYKGD
jgi:Bacteriophage clamp loader A subunit